jgi:hypothetical protein
VASGGVGSLAQAAVQQHEALPHVQQRLGEAALQGRDSGQPASSAGSAAAAGSAGRGRHGACSHLVQVS